MTEDEPEDIGGAEKLMWPSQDEYCRGCVLNIACNVVLRDGESCGDRAGGLSDLSYDEWEALGDTVPGKA
jgi:hypothetical protein